LGREGAPLGKRAGSSLFVSLASDERNRRQRLDELKTGDARPLPPHLKAQITRELDRLELLLEQIEAVEIERDALISAMKRERMNADAVRSPLAMLTKLNGIGPEIAAILWSEGLYRSFANRRQVAAYAGLAPTPWQSGSVAREQGVSKAGNPRLGTTMLQLAWLWLRHQPQSALTLWFHERVKRNSGRLRKTTIVALARKLLLALWKYATAGVVIDGAVHGPFSSSKRLMRILRAIVEPTTDLLAIAVADLFHRRGIKSKARR
jgi:transposase